MIGKHFPNDEESRNNFECVEVSAKTGEGLLELRSAIKKRALGRRLEGHDSVLVGRIRHTTLLRQARESLRQALEALNNGGAPEYLAMELRSALHSLGEIIGVVTNEDILDQVFSDFCIGK